LFLASSWFGHRARDLSAQIRLAAEFRFAGICLLPGAEPPQGVDLLPADRPSSIGAASWDGLAPAPLPGSPSAPLWSRATFNAVRTQLAALRCPLLILPVGVDHQADAPGRGERLLGRIRAGETLRNDEALEELRILEGSAAEDQLETLAALLHECLHHVPNLRIALAPGPSPAALLTPDRMRLLLAEIRHPGLGLWHDTADSETRAASGLPPAGAWLDAFGARILGVTLHDFAAGSDHLPPGAGIVDWPLLAEYLPRSAVRVLRLAPSYPDTLLTEARSLLAAHRLN
jgi:hypothetical protein